MASLHGEQNLGRALRTAPVPNSAGCLEIDGVQSSVLVAPLGSTWTHVFRCSQDGKEEEDPTKCDTVSDAVEKAPSVSTPRQQADQSAPTSYKSAPPLQAVGERVTR